MKRPNTECALCGKPIYKYPCLLKKGVPLFCSRSCRGRFIAWKGGRYVNSDGYVVVYRPDHPMAAKNGYVLEHRLIMAEHIGRLLLPDEEVHHKNRNRQDNDPIENLVLFSGTAEHLKHEREENGHLWKKRQANPSNKVSLFCPVCGVRFEKYRTNIKSDVVCCSKHCTQAFRAIGKRHDVTCVVCGKEFSRVSSDMNDHPTCSLECSAKRRSSGITVVQCVVCGKSIEKPTFRVEEAERKGRHHTCSSKCSNRVALASRTGNPIQKQQSIEGQPSP